MRALTRDRLNSITVDVRGLRLDSRDLALRFRALLELSHLLPLD